jgi:hypothetical protein
VSTTGAGQSTHLLLDVVAILKQEQLDYAVIGALAAAVHGVVRASLDADAVVQVTVQKLSELRSRFAALGLSTDLRRGDLEDPIPALLQISDVYGNRVDLLAGLRGLDRDAYTRALDLPFENATLRVIGREDFIAMKAFAGGPIDLADARRSVAISRESLNVELLLKLARGFGSDALRTCESLLAMNESTDI